MTDGMKPSRDIARLIEIMAALRTPVTGCPWDLDQTFATIAPYTIEEAYEVADAIARDDRNDLKDELGDLLLQVVYHARMAEEEGAFQFGDVVEGVTAKMIRRHPHVFGDETANSAGDVDGLWERIKAEERAARSNARAGDASDSDTRPSLLDGVPLALPALTRAVKLQHKAAKVGFDWPDIRPVFEKLKEEIAEFEAVATHLDPRGNERAAGGRLDEGESPDANRVPPDANRVPPDAGARTGRLAERESVRAIKEEFGDILFVMANIARHLDINPENALRDANNKFTRRFAFIEQRLAERDKEPKDSSLEEMDALWNEVRAADKTDPSNA